MQNGFVAQFWAELSSPWVPAVETPRKRAPDGPAPGVARPVITAGAPAEEQAPPAVDPATFDYLRIEKPTTSAPVPRNRLLVTKDTAGTAIKISWEESASPQERTAMVFSGLLPWTEYRVNCTASISSPLTSYLALRAGRMGIRTHVSDMQDAGEWRVYTAAIVTDGSGDIHLLAGIKDPVTSGTHELLLDDLRVYPIEGSTRPAPPEEQLAAAESRETKEAESPPAPAETPATTPQQTEESQEPEEINAAPGDAPPGTGSMLTASERQRLAADNDADRMLNGSFEAWKNGEALPEGLFQLPDPVLITVERETEVVHTGKTALRQTWTQSDSGKVPDACFQVLVDNLAPNTNYQIRVQSQREERAAAVIGVYGVDEDGELVKIEDPCVDNVEGRTGQWTQFTGEFNSGKFTSVHLVSRASRKRGMVFPQSMLLDAWEVLPAR